MLSDELILNHNKCLRHLYQGIITMIIVTTYQSVSLADWLNCKDIVIMTFEMSKQKILTSNKRLFFVGGVVSIF